MKRGKLLNRRGCAADLIKFLEVILGSLIAAPVKLLPVMNMPLNDKTVGNL